MQTKQLNVREVAERLGVTAATVYALCKRRLIKHSRIGTGRGTIRVSEAALVAYLDVVTIAPSEPSQGTG